MLSSSFSGGLKKKPTVAPAPLSGNPFINRPPPPAPPLPMAPQPAGGVAVPAGTGGAVTPITPPPPAPNTLPNAIPPPKSPTPLVKPNAVLPNLPKKKKKTK